MDRAKILAVVREVVAEVLAVPPETVTEKSLFRDDLGAESLDLLEITMKLEIRLDVSLSEEGLKDVSTVGEALDLISSGVPRTDEG